MPISRKTDSLAWRAAAAALALSIAGAAAAAVPVRAGLPAPADLGVDGALAAKRGKPLLLLFSLPDCAYCEVVRRNYLVPLTRDGREQERPVVRELEMTGSASLIGFGKARTSGTALAAHYKVRFAPTVLLLDGTGKLLAPPLVGGDVAGMYGAYLDAALADAQRSIAAATAPASKGLAR